jgi:anti-sigma regulatory factor (Ser/Thr protein kinase)
MTVAEMSIDEHHYAAPDLCRVRIWSLPAGSPHHAERGARTIIRDVLRAANVSHDEVRDTEGIVAELAVNAVQHAAPPYELRIVFVGRIWPTWCEVADCGSDLERVQRGLRGAAALSDDAMPDLAERGRGLLMVSGLSAGRCAAYPTTVCQTNSSGKAVGFALPGAAHTAHEC